MTEQLARSLDALEEGIVDLSCARGAFANVYELLNGAEDEQKETEYLDMLNIVTEYLASLTARLDDALGAAREAARAM